MKKPFAVAAAVSCIMAAGCSSESAPASTPLEVPAGVSTSPSESYPDRIEIPNGILDLSSLAVRQAFGGLPAAVSAHKQGLVLVLDKSNIVHLGNGATQYDRSLGTGFKADASHMVTAGHVIAGADRSEVNCGDTDIYTPPLTGGNNTFQAHLTEAAGSYAPDYSTPDLGIATVLNCIIRAISQSLMGLCVILRLQIQPNANQTKRRVLCSALCLVVRMNTLLLRALLNGMTAKIQRVTAQAVHLWNSATVSLLVLSLPKILSQPMNSVRDLVTE
jgi:hypothetical protein